MSSRIEELETILWAGGAQELVVLAAQGDPDAIYLVAIAHYDGDGGFDLDPGRCIDMLHRASESGHVEATHHLGCFRYYGYGLPDGFRDVEKSVALLQTSAAAGFPPSLTFLGSLYENGEGVQRDPGRARQLYQAAADAGDELGIRGVARLSSA